MFTVEFINSFQEYYHAVNELEMYSLVGNVVCNSVLCEQRTILLDDRSKNYSRLCTSFNSAKLVNHIEIIMTYIDVLGLIGLDVRYR